MFQTGTENQLKYGDFADQSEQLLNSSEFEFAKYKVKQFSQLPTDQAMQDIDGILITGSRSDAFNNNELWFLKLSTFIEKYINKVPICGICFGHQIIANVLGSKVARHEKGWEAGLRPVTLSAEFKRFFGLEADSFNIIESHKDIVYDIPDGYSNVGSTQHTAIQGFFNKSVLTFQGHPEFSNEFLKLLIGNLYKNRQISEKESESCLESFRENLTNDGSGLIRQLILDFYKQ